MPEYFHEEEARDYLLHSSQGENFIYEELHMGGCDDGPFGDSKAQGLAMLDLEIPEGVDPIIHSSLSINQQLSLNLPAGRFLKLAFEINDERYSSRHWSWDFEPLLLIATPRDPKGPFTISVYQDARHVGWLTGKDSEALAIHLVDNFDFGCAVVPVNCFDEEEEEQLSLKVFLKEEMQVLFTREPNCLISPELVSPSQLKWNFEPAIIDLQRKVTWDGTDMVKVDIENKAIVESFEGEDELVYLYDPEILLVPDVWKEGSTDIFVYVDDEYVGRVTDPEEAAKFHEELGGYEAKLGRARKGYYYMSADGTENELWFDGDIHPILRIDWEKVEPIGS